MCFDKTGRSSRRHRSAAGRGEIFVSAVAPVTPPEKSRANRAPSTANELLSTGRHQSTLGTAGINEMPNETTRRRTDEHGPILAVRNPPFRTMLKKIHLTHFQDLAIGQTHFSAVGKSVGNLLFSKF